MEQTWNSLPVKNLNRFNKNMFNNVADISYTKRIVCNIVYVYSPRNSRLALYTIILFVFSRLAHIKMIKMSNIENIPTTERRCPLSCTILIEFLIRQWLNCRGTQAGAATPLLLVEGSTSGAGLDRGGGLVWTVFRKLMN